MITTEQLVNLYLDAIKPPETVFNPRELEHFGNWCKISNMHPEGAGGAEFGFQGRKYLEELYNETRSKLRPRVVNRKAAQLGLTVRELYRGAWLTADSAKRLNIGFMFPTEKEVRDLHATRFRPMMQSSIKMLDLIGQGGLDNIHVVRIGYSNMRFRGMGTGASVDSVPLDVLLFDEVRLMSTAMIERAFLRVSESNLKALTPEGEQVNGLVELNSTAGFPDANIDYYFQKSTQNTWHVFCPNGSCPNSSGMVLEQVFPACVDTKTMTYICPKCGTAINDTQNGAYIRLGSLNAEWEGYAFSRILKGNSYLPQLWSAYLRMVVEGVNPQEFYNSYLGLPYQDKNAVMVPQALFDAAREIEPSYRWVQPTDAVEGHIVAGIDQGELYHHIVILRLSSSGRYYLHHIEIVKTAGKSNNEIENEVVGLLKHWQISVVVVDAMPSFSFASGIARKLPYKMCWLSYYVHHATKQPLEWHDLESRAESKTVKEGKYEFEVHIHRYKHLYQALTFWKNYKVLLPVNAYEDKRIELIKQGKPTIVSLVAEMREHFANIARITVEKTKKIKDEVLYTGEQEHTFVNINLDPHFVHAFGYAVAASMKVASIARITPQYRPESNSEPVPQLGQLPNEVQQVLKEQQRLFSKEKVCGTCQYFESKTSETICTNLRKQRALGVMGSLQVKPEDGNCVFWSKVRSGVHRG